ncbi:MAG: hypothetical protein SGARI_008235, partial [Bacillariaceae sp.]
MSDEENPPTDGPVSEIALTDLPTSRPPTSIHSFSRTLAPEIMWGPAGGSTASDAEIILDQVRHFENDGVVEVTLGNASDAPP